MINKRIVISGLSILSSLALMAGASFALFSDSASSQDNKFSTGNADLQIAEDVVPQGDPGTYFDSITGVSFSDIAPGFTMNKDFWLKNNSAGDFGMNLTVDLNDLKGTTPDPLDDNLMVMFRCDTDQTPGINEGDATTVSKSVADWLTGDPVALPSVGANEGASNATTASDQDELLCRMTASLSSEVGNAVEGTDLSFDVFFEGTQSI